MEDQREARQETTVFSKVFEHDCRLIRGAEFFCFKNCPPAEKELLCIISELEIRRGCPFFLFCAALFKIHRSQRFNHFECTIFLRVVWIFINELPFLWFVGIDQQLKSLHQAVVGDEQLEAKAKLLYDYWFVQFDFPVTAAQAAAIGKSHLEGKPYRASGGKMIFNETLKRVIPEGWEVSTLSQFANITLGQSPPGFSYNQDGIGTVFFQGSTDFGWRFPQVREYTTAPSRLADEGDILLSVRAPVGTLNVADRKCCIGRGLAALNAKDGHDSFLYEVMLYFKMIFDRRNAAGTTFGAITKDDLHALEFSRPPKGSPLLGEFEEIARPLREKILVNHRQNQHLSELRDWLLPMLMNGQVTVV